MFRDPSGMASEMEDLRDGEEVNYNIRTQIVFVHVYREANPLVPGIDKTIGISLWTRTASGNGRNNGMFSMSSYKPSYDMPTEFTYGVDNGLSVNINVDVISTDPSKAADNLNKLANALTEMVKYGGAKQVASLSGAKFVIASGEDIANVYKASSEDTYGKFLENINMKYFNTYPGLTKSSFWRPNQKYLNHYFEGIFSGVIYNKTISHLSSSNTIYLAQELFDGGNFGRVNIERTASFLWLFSFNVHENVPVGLFLTLCHEIRHWYDSKYNPSLIMREWSAILFQEMMIRRKEGWILEK